MNNDVLREFGKYLLDISKLTFGGVILSGIMKIPVNFGLLYTLGSIIVLITAFGGLYLVYKSKK